MALPERITQPKHVHYIIGIDPDCERSGVAIVDVESRSLMDVGTLDFFGLYDKFKSFKLWTSSMQKNFHVIIEGGWLNKGNWHLGSHVFGSKNFMSLAKSCEIGRGVGRNHQTGMLIEEMCRYCGISYDVVKPLKKCWHGNDGKITAEELTAFTGWHARTSQDARDAALLAWVHAGLPIRITPHE